MVTNFLLPHTISMRAFHKSHDAAAKPTAPAPHVLHARHKSARWAAPHRSVATPTDENAAMTAKSSKIDHIVVGCSDGVVGQFGSRLGSELNAQAREKKAAHLSPSHATIEKFSIVLHDRCRSRIERPMLCNIHRSVHP
jgi:hypothetical protein